MDPLSITGTLVAFAQICGNVIITCRRYQQSTKDAAKDISRILGEVEDVRSITQRLIAMALADHAADLSSLQAMNDSDSSLQRCLDELVDLKASLKPTKLGKLTWHFKKAEVDAKIQTLANVKATLQLGLAADNA
jgi:hypothetical protein